MPKGTFGHCETWYFRGEMSFSKLCVANCFIVRICTRCSIQVNDRRNGKGTYVFSNGSRYTGHWWENDIHTKGRFDYACGSYYRGEMKFDFPNGTAVSLPK